jgi:hypothetical protein
MKKYFNRGFTLKGFYGGSGLFSYSNFIYIKIIEDVEGIVENINFFNKKTLVYQIQGRGNLSRRKIRSCSISKPPSSIK